MSDSNKSRKKPHSTRTANSKKKVRSARGVAETKYGEIKKIASFSLTPTALVLLKELSQDLNISTSELLERFARLGVGFKDQIGQEVTLGAQSTPLEALNKS